MPVARLRHTAVASLAAVAVIFASATAVAATPSEDLALAKSKFLAGEFSVAINILSALLYPRPKLAEKSQLAEAHILLGVSYFETGNADGASTEFEEALFLDIGLTVEPPFFSEKASEAFKRKKKELVKKADENEEQKRLAAEAARLRDIVANTVFIEKRNYLVNFAPAGLGQFQNGHRKKGIGLFVSQGVTFGTMSAMFLYQAIKYGLFNGTVPRNEVETVNIIQAVQVTSGTLFFALWAYGIGDSLYHYEPQIERRADPALLEKLKQIEDQIDNQRGTDRAPVSRAPPPPQLFVAPTLSPHSVGLTLGMEF